MTCHEDSVYVGLSDGSVSIISEESKTVSTTAILHDDDSYAPGAKQHKPIAHLDIIVTDSGKTVLATGASKTYKTFLLDEVVGSCESGAAPSPILKYKHSHPLTALCHSVSTGPNDPPCLLTGADSLHFAIRDPLIFSKHNPSREHAMASSTGGSITGLAATEQTVIECRGSTVSILIPAEYTGRAFFDTDYLAFSANQTARASIQAAKGFLQST